MTIQEKLLTIEEFQEHYEGQPYELVEGVPTEMSPSADIHGKLAARILIHLGVYVEENDLGEVRAAETGFILKRDPDTVRAADASFIAKKRLVEISDDEAFTSIPPDLAAEVVSKDDSANEVQAKVQDYLQAGIRLIWIVYPKQQIVIVYYPDGRAETLSGDDSLTGGDVVPGFEYPLHKLFK